MRTAMHLNNGWKYADNFNQTYVSPTFDDAGFADVRLPHTNKELPYNNFDEKLYQFVSCYRKRFTPSGEEKGKRAVLHFEGVMTYAEVYVNGTFICKHAGGYTPFQCDVSKLLRCDAENVIVVMVDSTERPDIPPFGYVIDYLTYGGIYREVWLEFTNRLYLEDVFIKTRDVCIETKLLELDVAVVGDDAATGAASLQFELRVEDGSCQTFQKEIHITSSHEIVNHRQEIEGVTLWDIEHPILYTLHIRLEKDGSCVDSTSVRFGFREAEFRKDGFYLNCKKLKLRGLNRHQCFPYVGYAMPKSAQYKDAELLKSELGVNLVRTSHYPQSVHFLDRCDELGLLVFEEFPGWQHIGGEDWKQTACESVSEMILRDRNHPCVILWGVRINESQDDDDFYRKTNAIARTLDSTRQTGGVRNFEESHFFEDVYTYNDFVHRGNNGALKEPRKVYKKGAPYLVTEHNGHMFPTKKIDCEERRTEHALRHTRVLNTMYANPGISGAIGWCMFDYNTHRDFGSGDKICYHGVTDMFRLPKLAAAVYASQQNDLPVLEISSEMNRGDVQAADLAKVYAFTNCDIIKMYKNDQHIGSYTPSKAHFGNLPHPPVVIDDFIGNLLEKNEKFCHNDSENIKSIFRAIVQYGDKSLPLKYKIKMVKAMVKAKLSYKQAVDLFTKYVADWGCESLVYRFEGYRGDKLVKTVSKGPAFSKRLEVTADAAQLKEAETYDTCRVVIRHLDTLDNVMVYSAAVASLLITGPGEIIGPKTLPLIGGSSAFWVKTTGEAGDIRVTVTSEGLEPITLTLPVVCCHTNI